MIPNWTHPHLKCRETEEVVLQLPSHEHNSVDIGFVFSKRWGKSTFSLFSQYWKSLSKPSWYISDPSWVVWLSEESGFNEIWLLTQFSRLKISDEVQYKNATAPWTCTRYATWNQSRISSWVWYVHVLLHLSHKYPKGSDLPWKFLFVPFFLHFSFFFSNDCGFEHMALVKSNEGFKKMYNQVLLLQAHPLLHMLGHKTSGSPARLTRLLGRFSCSVITNWIIITSRGWREVRSLLCEGLNWHWCQGTLVTTDTRILSLVIQKEKATFSRSHSSWVAKA